MQHSKHFKASIHYLPAEQGGIITPVSSGFRTIIKFPFDSNEYFGEQLLPDDEMIYAGDTVTAEIRLRSNYDDVKLYEGLDFEMIVNGSIIGTGVVTEVL